MTRQHRPTSPETGPMLLVDCPICDHAAPIDETSGDLDCASCGVRLDVAPDAAELAIAA